MLTERIGVRHAGFAPAAHPAGVAPGVGTVTAVAELLSYTHSAISQQLAQCEKDVGAKLYERAGRRIVLTEQGELLADYADELLALADAAQSAVIDWGKMAKLQGHRHRLGRHGLGRRSPQISSAPALGRGSGPLRLADAGSV